MRVKFKRYHKDAKIPTKAYKGDFCYDCYAVTEEQIAPNVWKYDLGFGLQIVRDSNIDDDSLLSIDIRPRSSVWKTGMILSNCEGTIDEGYLNTISAVFYHVMPNMPRYKVGDRICQMKIGATLPIEFVEVDELNDTERGMKGYGSSGL